MLALVASIHVSNTAFISDVKTWMVGTSPTMTGSVSLLLRLCNFAFF